MSCKLRRMLRPLPIWKIDEDIDRDSRNSSITFGAVEIREYNRVLGEHSDIYYSLALGWEYHEQEPISVEEYKSEVEPPTSKETSSKNRFGIFKKLSRSKSQRPFKNHLEPTTRHERMKILKYFGYSKEELNGAEKERVQKLQCPSKDNQRPTARIFRPLCLSPNGQRQQR
jgi:hypothetical protein